MKPIISEARRIRACTRVPNVFLLALLQFVHLFFFGFVKAILMYYSWSIVLHTSTIINNAVRTCVYIVNYFSFSIIWSRECTWLHSSAILPACVECMNEIYIAWSFVHFLRWTFKMHQLLSDAVSPFVFWMLSCWAPKRATQLQTKVKKKTATFFLYQSLFLIWQAMVYLTFVYWLHSL